MYVVADLGNLTTIDEYRKTVMENIKNIDVAIVVLNAGLTAGGPFGSCDDKKLEQLINCNIGHTTYMIKLFVPLMQERKKRSAIVITSALAADHMIGIPGMAAYAASKSYSKFLGGALNYELKD